MMTMKPKTIEELMDGWSRQGTVYVCPKYPKEGQNTKPSYSACWDGSGGKVRWSARTTLAKACEIADRRNGRVVVSYFAGSVPEFCM